GQRALDVRDALAAIDSDDLDPRHTIATERRDENLAGAAVLEDVRADLGHHERDVAGARRVEAESFRKLRRRATGRGDLAPVLDDQRPRRGDHFHRVIITRVPPPGPDPMLNALEW